MTRRSLAGCGLSLLLLATSAQAQTPRCAPRATVVEQLSSRYGESRQVVGLNANNTMMELFASVETGSWTSPTTGIRYPQGWRLVIPAHDIELHLGTRLPAQEWHRRFRYWEGAVSVTGSHTGRGYVELAGY